MKNVTITLPEDLAAWVRVEAAKADRSMSSWIAELLEERRRTGQGGVSAADDLLSGPLINVTALGRPLDREGIHDRALLRRHERPHLRPGSE